jgi:RNA polymerase sigma-70 factor (ECF subfamily)
VHGFDQELPPLAASDAEKIDPAIVAALYIEHEAELKRFLWGVLRDGAAVQDVLQAAFVKMMEHGHTTQEESRKAWLFRVAYHEALGLRRRQATAKKAEGLLAAIRNPASGAADEPLIRLEAIQAVREAMKRLPPEQREVVVMRIYEEKTFAQIAQELNIPLGTALARMRLALAKMRQAMPDFHNP